MLGMGDFAVRLTGRSQEGIGFSSVLDGPGLGRTRPHGKEQGIPWRARQKRSDPAKRLDKARIGRRIRRKTPKEVGIARGMSFDRRPSGQTFPRRGEKVAPRVFWGGKARRKENGGAPGGAPPW